MNFRPIIILLTIVGLIAVLDLQISNAHTEPADPPLGKLSAIAEGLDFPSNLIPINDGSGRVLVLEKNLGIARVLKEDKLSDEIFLDIHDRLVQEPNDEQGLLSMAFPPDYQQEENVYVTYIQRDSKLVLSRLTVSKDGKHAIINSENNLLTLTPFRTSSYTGMHYCGHIAFGRRTDTCTFALGTWTTTAARGRHHRNCPCLMASSCAWISNPARIHTAFPRITPLSTSLRLARKSGPTG